jgi:hypothetical protein
MHIDGANPAAYAVGVDELEGKVNYFIGSDPAAWRTNVPTFGQVRYREVYPGIDVVYYGNQQHLEYDFVVAPGRDPSSISLSFEGAERIRTEDATGDLLLSVGESTIRQHRPLVYQDTSDGRQVIESRYILDGSDRVAFGLGEYDTSKPLVIDPILVYSTYLGGSDSDQAWGIAVDAAGSAYVAGVTLSTDFDTATPIQAANAGFQDAFVAKLNPAGNALVYSTYLGGSDNDMARGLAIDSAGSAYITGPTNSDNFPTASAYDATLGTTNEDAFVTKLSVNGSALVYSTYLGGDESSEFGQAITVDSAGNAYVTGTTFSDDFPVVNPIQEFHGGGSVDAYLSVFNAGGNALTFSSYFGGSGNETGFGVRVDPDGNIYLTGETDSPNFPTFAAYQAAFGGDRDAFALKITAASPRAFIYSTYLGGNGLDVGQAIAVNAAGNAFLGGQSSSTNFPTTAGSFRPANAGGVLQDAFVTKLSPDGSALVYSTYYGGLGGEIAFGIAIDSAENVYIGGATGSTNSLPRVNATQCVRGGSFDAFAAKLNPAGSALVYSTYFGGSDDDRARSVDVDASGNAYFAGYSTSTNFPTLNPYQGTFAGGDSGFFPGDAVIFKLGGLSSSICTTVAGVSVSGQIRTSHGRGVTGAQVTIYHPDGTSLSTLTSRNGSFRFDGVEVGRTYAVSVTSNRFSFTPRFVEVTDAVTGFDFVSE